MKMARDSPSRFKEANMVPSSVPTDQPLFFGAPRGLRWNTISAFFFCASDIEA